MPPENDKRKWESITIHGSRRQADKALREKVGDVENGRYVPKVKQTVGEYLQEWLDGTCATTLRQRTVWGKDHMWAGMLAPSLVRNYRN